MTNPNFSKIAKLTLLSTIVLSTGFTLLSLTQNPIKAQAATTPVQKCYIPTGTNPGANVPSTQEYRTDWGGPKTCTFTKFDKNLGKLTGVTTTIDAIMKTDAQVENLNNGPTTIAVSTTANVTLSTSTGDQLALAAPTVKTDGKPLGTYDGTSDYGGTSGATFASQQAQDSKSNTVTTQSVLDTFNGDGVQTITTTGKTTTIYTSLGSANVLMNANTYAAGSISVSYSYQTPPVANPGTFSNTAVDGNVDLSTALSTTDPAGNPITKNTIKTLPDAACGGLYYKDATGAEKAIVVGQALTPAESLTLFLKPAAGSQGKFCTFTYTATNNLDMESQPATITVKLKSPYVEPAPVVKQQAIAPVGGQFNPTDACNNSGKIKDAIDVTSCFKTAGAEFYRISNINTGKESCGDFFLVKTNGDRIRISENQDVTLTDSKIIFSPNSSDCKVCSDIGFDITPYTSSSEALKKYRSNITMTNCEVDTIRTGGFVETIKENLVLLMILIAAIIFFFTTITSEQNKTKSENTPIIDSH
jgi:hypothetical protein